MITSYQFKRLENNEVGLFLYLDENAEFSLDLFARFRDFDWDRFFRKYGSFLDGCKVFLVVGGVVFALSHTPIVKKDDTRGWDFVTYNSLFSEKVDVVENKNNELLSYLNHFLESSSVPFLYEKDKNVDSNVGDVKQENIGAVENNKDFAVNNSGFSNNNNNNYNDNNKDSNNYSSGVVNQNNNSSGNNNFSQSGNSGSQNQEEVKEEAMDREESTTSGMMIRVYRSNGTILEIEMEEYLVGVVAAEMPASFHVEALKAQSILARTYAMKRIEAGLSLTDTVATQRYIDKIEMKKMWGSGFEQYYQKIKSAVDATKGKVILYNGQLIDAVYHSTSNGRTEDAIFVWGRALPYLVSVDSSWDRNVNSYSRSMSFDIERLCEVFGVLEDKLSFQILSRNQSGRVEFVQVGEKVYTGVEIRTLLGLRSADFDISYHDREVVFQTRGYGHGVGLSQYGANEMAKQGYSYLDIIKHYYKGVVVGSI